MESCVLKRLHASAMLELSIATRNLELTALNPIDFEHADDI